MASNHSADCLVTGSVPDHSENDPIAKGDLIDLCTSAGWSNYTRNLDLLYRAVENSLWELSVQDDHELAGLVRAVGDDASIVYVQGILVRPDRQHNGIGTCLAVAVLECFAHVSQTVLIVDDESKAIPFYQSVGMTNPGEPSVRGFARSSF